MDRGARGLVGKGHGPWEAGVSGDGPHWAQRLSVWSRHTEARGRTQSRQGLAHQFKGEDATLRGALSGLAGGQNANV